MIMGDRVVLTNENIRSAVSLWCKNRSGCEEMYGHIKNWDVAAVTDMSELFDKKNTFNEDISNWDVSNVKDMHHMFRMASIFNQNLSKWDVGKVEDMNNMFFQAYAFNGDVSEWQVGNVKNMGLLFCGASSFNQDIGGWDVSKVKSMTGMFQGASKFNQDVGRWDVTSVCRMNKMFYKLEIFNQDISNWDVSNVAEMVFMFNNTGAFCQDLSGWDVRNVSEMDGIFDNAKALQPIFARLGISSLFDEKLRSMSLPERQAIFSSNGNSITSVSLVVKNPPPIPSQEEQNMKAQPPVSSRPPQTEKQSQANQQHAPKNEERKQVKPNSLYTWLESDVFNDKTHLVEPVFTKFKEEEECDSLEELLKNCRAYNWAYLREEMKFRPVVATRIEEALEKLQEKERLKKKKSSEIEPVHVGPEQRPINEAGYVKFIQRSEVKMGRRIGGGSFGVVHEGEFDFKIVALKSFGTSGLLTVRSVREVRNEVEIMSRLDHPALVRLLGLVCEEREGSEHPPMLVMEYGTHGSLYSFLNSDNDLSGGLRLRMAAGLAGGLSYLHKKKVIHSDIKSLNVVLGDGLVAKWCDFGLSSLKGHSTATMSLSPSSSPRCGVGTLRWMSPEMFHVTSLSPTFQSDIWAFGMVLYELETSEVPFQKASHDEQVKECIRQWDGNCVPDSCRSGSSLTALGKIMSSCWVRQPGQRPTAGAVEGHLAQALADLIDSTNETKGDPSTQSGVMMNGTVMNTLPPHPSTFF